MKILIGILAYNRQIDIEIVRTIVNLERQQKHEFDYIFPVSSHISRNRNMVAQEGLKDGHDAVLFWDSDIGIGDEGFIDKLIETGYKFDAKIVGGAYRMKKPNDELVYIAGDSKDGKIDNFRTPLIDPQKCEFVGTGCMLIFREVLEKLSDPWFTIIDKPNLEVMPEDFEFCRKAKEAGFTIAIDPRFSTNHFGARAWTTESLRYLDAR